MFWISKLLIQRWLCWVKRTRGRFTVKVPAVKKKLLWWQPEGFSQGLIVSSTTIMRSIEGRWSQDSHGLSVSSGEAACVSSNPTLEIYYCIVVTLAPPSSPTTTLSPVHSYGDPSSLMLDPSQAETTNEESLGIVASHQLLYIASHQLLHLVHRTHSGLHPNNCCTCIPSAPAHGASYT